MRKQSCIPGSTPSEAFHRLKGPARMFACMTIAFSICGVASAQPGPGECGSIDNGSNGPFDYRTNRGHTLKAVEDFHFTPNVESLVSGTSGPIGADLNYTLTAFPNHHRALLAMVRFGEKLKTSQPPHARSVECYFERALRFRPSDSTVRMIYATFLAKAGRMPETIKQLEFAKVDAGDNAFTHYNIGLIYFDIKNYDEALSQAHISYGLGFGRPALRDQLKSVGKWKEPEEKSAKSSSEVVTPGSADAAKPNTDNSADPNKSGAEK